MVTLLICLAIVVGASVVIMACLAMHGRQMEQQDEAMQFAKDIENGLYD